MKGIVRGNDSFDDFLFFVMFHVVEFPLFVLIVFVTLEIKSFHLNLCHTVMHCLSISNEVFPQKWLFSIL